MYKEELRKELDRLLGNYVPNKADMDNLSSYLYKLVVSVFKDADMKKEYKSIKGITQLDEDGFKKAVRDISLFTSQKVMVGTLNKTYRDLKNIIPMTTITDDIAQKDIAKKSIPVNNSNSVAEAGFSIDLKKVPKIKQPKKPKVEKKEEVLSSEFESNVELDLDEINKNTLKLSQVTSSSSDSDDDGDLTLGAGFLGEGYNSVPDIDISLDY